MLHKPQHNSNSLICHRPIIELENVSFAYNQKPVINHVNFTALERDFVGLIGSNGAGKTTLLRMIVGLLAPTGGTVKLFGEPIQQWLPGTPSPRKTLLGLIRRCRAPGVLPR